MHLCKWDLWFYERLTKYYIILLIFNLSYHFLFFFALKRCPASSCWPWAQDWHKHNDSEFHNTQVLREDAPNIVALRASEGKAMGFWKEEYAYWINSFLKITWIVEALHKLKNLDYSTVSVVSIKLRWLEATSMHIGNWLVHWRTIRGLQCKHT